VSPRKSSTSSARRSDAPRPRYLGLEVAGEHLPPPTPHGWETLLRGSAGPKAFRLIRAEGFRAIVEVGHRSAGDARASWNGSFPDGLRLTTVRTWGTLLGAKRWLAGRRGPRGEPSPAIGSRARRARP